MQTNPKSQTGKAITSKTMFSRETSINVNIEADPSIVWALLTHASDVPRWNSTVVSLKGEIKEGGTIELKSTLDEKRVFKLKVKEFVPEKRLVGVIIWEAAFIRLINMREVFSLRCRKRLEAVVSFVCRYDSLLR